jgi:hypothetical protein
MFLEPDEHIIVMEDDIVYPWTLDDLMKIEDAGIKTVQIPHALYIDRNYSHTDKSIERILKTNLKMLIPFYYSDTYQNIFENYSEAIVNQIDEFAISTLERYADLQSKIQFTYAIPQGGEFLWDAMKVDNYPVSDETIIKFIIGRQKILVQQHSEIWLHLHNFLGHHDNWNNHHLPYVYKDIRSEFPDYPFYSIQYAHYACGGTPTNEMLRSKIIDYTTWYGIKFFVGSEYCEGLSINFNRAMREGAYGFVTAPTHDFNSSKHTKIQDWMVTKLQETNERFNEHYKVFTNN